MSIGNVRRIDRLGRICIPLSIRRSLNIPDETMFEIFEDDGLVVLKRYEPEETLLNALNELEGRLNMESIDMRYGDVRDIKQRIREIREILCKER